MHTRAYLTIIISVTQYSCTMTNLKIQVKKISFLLERKHSSATYAPSNIVLDSFKVRFVQPVLHFHHIKIHTIQPKETHLSHIHF